MLGFLRGLPAECLEGLVQEGITPGSWSIMKSVDFLSRAQRRHLWGARRWIVHIFAGNPGHHQLFRLDEGSTAVLELDLDRCKAHDITAQSTWRLLMWGALTGKIDAVVGGPPGRSGLLRADRDVKILQLMTRMIWLYSVATISRRHRGIGYNKDRPVAFVTEHPSSTSLTTSSGVDRSLWGTTLWQEFSSELNIDEVTFDQRLTGAATSCPTTLGTNVYYLKGLADIDEGEAVEEAEPTRRGGATWSTGLVEAIVMALRFWNKEPREATSLKAMTVKQWADHVASGHANYRRDCLTCVMGRGTGKRHARVRHPDSFCLTVDVAGPVKPGVDATSKGAMGKGLRYMVVARFTLPREYVKGFTGRKPPEDDGLGQQGDEARGLELLDKELVKPSLPQPHEGEEDKQQSSDVCLDEELVKPSLPQPHEGEEDKQQSSDVGLDEELVKPSLPQPHEGEDPFIFCDDELGEQGPLVNGDDELGEQGPSYDAQKKYAGSSVEQRAGLQDYEDSLYEPSECDDEEEVGPRATDGVCSEVIQDCEEPETTYLLFAKGVKDNLSSTVKGVIQDIILYLEAHGLPVYRLHADKGETFNHYVRGWLRDRGIRATWSEPGVPQGNGAAEAAVRWVKDRARTLLLSSRLPARLWTVAVEAATAMQRTKVLGWRSRLMAPFGAVVHIKEKAFNSSGPRKRERAFETKWIRGVYVGLSSILDGGHVVYVPQTDPDNKEKFFHTFHVRPRLHDPGPPEQELQMDNPPKPRRRIPVKTSLDHVEMRTAGLSEGEAREYVVQRSRCLLEAWDQAEAERFIVELVKKGFFDDRKFGIFRHGGSVGWMTGSEEFPDLARVLAKIMLESEPEATFTSLWVTRDSTKGYHKDVNNDADTNNYALPLQVPDQGGELWLELGSGDVLRGEVAERIDGKGRRHYGQLLPLIKGKCNVFSPRQGHEVLPWKGERIMVIADTPQCMGKLDYDVVKRLEGLGFPTPLSQLPEYFSPGGPEMSYVTPQEKNGYEEHPQEENPVNTAVDIQEDADWEMFLEVPDGKVKIGDQDDQGECPRPPVAAKIDLGYTRNIEQLLSNLTSPLKVTHNVDPHEVQENLEVWRGAIEKEVKNVEVAILRLMPGSSERASWIKRPRVQRLPAKLVFTVKPGDCPAEGEPETWYKRKARLVVCGNFARTDDSDLYSETPPTEVLRAGLVLSRKRQWEIAILDVVAAFLRAPIGDNPSDPVVLVAPPRLLERLGLIVECELWALVRALYGLRQAPALWSSYRDKTLDGMRFPGNLTLRRGRTVTAWWVMQDHGGNVLAVIIIYVDDFMLIGSEETIKLLANAIQGLWKTSPLTFLTTSSPIRFLGMELELSEDKSAVYVNQSAYIEEVLRAYEVNPNYKDKIPISKELSSFEVGPDDTPPTAKDVAAAQRLTGELMWVAQKTRPDLSYTCSLLASLSTQAPARCLAV